MESHLTEYCLISSFLWDLSRATHTHLPGLAAWFQFSAWAKHQPLTTTVVLFQNCAMVTLGPLNFLHGPVSSTAPTHTQNCNPHLQVSLVWSCDDFLKSVSQISTDLPMYPLLSLCKGNKTHLFVFISSYAFPKDKVFPGAHYYLHSFFLYVQPGHYNQLPSQILYPLRAHLFHVSFAGELMFDLNFPKTK